MRLFSDVSQLVRDPWLRYACHLAERGRGTTSPNPLVGCVIVVDDVAVGEGYHAYAGGPHAERVALDAAGEAARGATVYVTLEPCAHEGRTPPCVPALLEAGVSRVVIGMLDPNPQVAGGGADALREAGVEVQVAEDSAPFAAQNEAWLLFVREGRPYVRVKTALSLDGHPALDAGHRAYITGVAGAEVTRVLRSRADAVLVGSSTVAVDDPALTVRDAEGVLAERQPIRVVLARHDAPPVTSRVFTDGVARTIVLLSDDAPVDPDALVGRGIQVVTYPAGDGILGALESLADLGVMDLMVEAGPHLFSSLWSAGLVDEAIVVTAGGMAGPDAPPLFLGEAERSTDRLTHSMHALEAGVVEDVAVSVWQRTLAEPASHLGREVRPSKG